MASLFPTSKEDEAFGDCACVVARCQLGTNVDILMFYERKLFIVVWKEVKQFKSICTYKLVDSDETKIN